MGSIKQQGISSGIYMYAGMILGFVNSVLLFPKIVGAEVFGFTQWLVEAAGLFLLLAGFGSNSAIIRFFPYFKAPDEQHRGYLGFLFVLRTLGLLLTILLIFVTRDGIIGLFSEPESRIYVDRYYYLLPVFLVFLCYFEMLESYVSALLRPRIPTLLRDVFNRVTTTLLILAYFFHWINLDQFIVLFASRLLLTVMGMLGYVFRIGEFYTRIDWNIFRRPVFGQIVNFSFYSVFATLGSKIINKLDMFMISALLGFTANGVYAVFYFASTAIVVPHQGIAKITAPLMADKWKREEMGELQELYRRTALNNLAVGVLLFIGIFINLDHLITILGPEYAPGRYVAIFLGVAQLVHIVNGYNGLLITYSPKYRVDLVIKVITASITIVSNYFFIRWYGLTGAAMATTLTIILINILIQLFVWREFRMHPFSRGMLVIALIGGATLALNTVLPEIKVHFLLDLLYRSSVVTLCYGLALLFFNPAPDLTDFFWNLVKRLLKR